MDGIPLSDHCPGIDFALEVRGGFCKEYKYCILTNVSALSGPVMRPRGELRRGVGSIRADSPFAALYEKCFGPVIQQGQSVTYIFELNLLIWLTRDNFLRNYPGY
ncbi:hypothetical protein RF11_16404 [Thelohanellus kitauei]|uniref:Uncharacterized protein n=1 Tax=Thelohanellus kitauei TaxID=669202 RepID=A0A0C2IE87_THEKT|nr:hypothetical protein RF11_16404 [Thelohanellus kitauei]